jgi:proteasome accessory factor B
MSSRKTERQLDLLFILLNSTRALTREIIREKIEDYKSQQSQEAFERMFERDKEELRNAGIPIETKQLNPLFEDEYGYSLQLQNFSYQSSSFNAAELAELTRSALIWEDTTLAANARLGLVKSHTAAGNDLNLSEEFNFQHLISSHHYVVITEAIVNQKIVEFSYLKPQQTKASTRRVFPLSVTSRNSTVYLSAWEIGDNKAKTFSFLRISGEVSAHEASSEEIRLAKKAHLQSDLEHKKLATVTPLNSLIALQHEIGGEEIAGQLSIEYFDEESFAGFLTPFAFQIADIKPESLKKLVVSQLTLILEKLS